MDDVQKMRALRGAIKDGDTDKVVTLLQSNPGLLDVQTPFGSWLHVAASFGKLEIVKLLLKLGINVNARGGTFNGGAINLAASGGHLDVAKCLLDSGAVLDVSEPERNPLFAGIYGGHVEIVKLFLERGIDVTVRYTGSSMNNMDAYGFALERGEEEIAELLKEAELGKR